MQCIALEYHPNDSRIKIDNSGTIQTLTQRMGTGGNNVPLILIMKDEPLTDCRGSYTNNINTSASRGI